MLPGQRWMGIILLFSTANGELLAIMNDGVLQRYRVGGANGVVDPISGAGQTPRPPV